MNPDESLCLGCFINQPGFRPCTTCGYDESAARSPLLLPHRTILHDQYLVGRDLRIDESGVLYLAWDLRLRGKVAIREYAPLEIVRRGPCGRALEVCSEKDAEGFRLGLEEFTHAARIYAKIDHPHVQRVRMFFEENSTGYLVLDHIAGVSLAEYVGSKGGKVNEVLAVDIILPVLDGLRGLHERGLLHRMVSPENIFISVEEQPILLGFGGAPAVGPRRSGPATAAVAVGFSPPERYRLESDEGPWTDVYSAAASAYYLLTGMVPPAATEREARDLLEPPHRTTPGISVPLGVAVMRALSLNPSQRPQAVTKFQEMLLSVRPQRAINGPSPEPRLALSARWLLIKGRLIPWAMEHSRMLAAGLAATVLIFFIMATWTRRVVIVRKQGQFILYSDDVVIDTETGLMWAAADNGGSITWPGAKMYCEKYRGGGYADWRMPSIKELQSLYDEKYSQRNDCSTYTNRNHLTPLIRITCSSVWSAEHGSSSYAKYCFFGNGNEGSVEQYYNEGGRALPVRTVR